MSFQITHYCRTCKAEIVWVTMERSGKKNPLDVVPVRDGNIAIVSTHGSEHMARGVSPEEKGPLVSRGVLLYVSHFVSCPQSKLHKKNGPRPSQVSPGSAKAESRGASARAETEAYLNTAKDALQGGRR